MDTPTKQDFTALITRIQAMTSHIDTAYPAMIAAATPYDRELARKLEAARKADVELLEYVKSKAESQHLLPNTVIVGLLGG